MHTIESREIAVNQISYPAQGKKIAIFTGEGGTFQVIDESNEVVFTGQTSKAKFDELSGVTVCSGDFSELTTIGTYRIKLNQSESSMFEISNQPYKNLHHGLLKAFYLFRCGIELEEQFAGEYKHQACHTKKGIVHGENRELDCAGGWHDAGDYGKYTVAAAKAVADLLLAYDFYPTAFSDTIPIPETDNVTPHVLHECRYELEWLIKMQDELSGGVFHKLTTLRFPGLNVMPEDDDADLYFSPISATATASFAAIMAMSSRIYKSYDSKFAETCLNAAIKANNWLEHNPSVPGFKNPQEISTGEYGDSIDIDERYWAMAELYRTTGEETYHSAFQNYASKNFNKYRLGWADVGGYGTISYLLNEKAASPILHKTLKAGLIEEADSLVSRSNNNGYLISLEEDEYIWGSNMLVMNHAMTLLFAFRLTGDKTYEDAALDHLHYILGRNVLDLSYVTNFGDRSVVDHHHRPSVGDNVEAPVPGLVSGGPNKKLQDRYMKKHFKGKAPAQCFADHKDSYSTNEVTIYWNSPTVFVVSHWINKEM